MKINIWIQGGSYATSKSYKHFGILLLYTKVQIQTEITIILYSETMTDCNAKSSY